MSKKRIMRAFKINEISVVDKPAQPGALMSIMKRHSEEPITKGSVLTTNDEGHAHLIYCLEEGGGTTSYSQMPGEDQGHSHPYVITDENEIIIGDAEGHSHKVKAFGKSLINKTEDGKQFGPGDYAHVADVTKTDTWKLRLTDTPGGKPDPRTVGAAVTALSKLALSNSEEHTAVIHRVTKAWLSANPDKTQDDLPAILKATTTKQSTKETTMTKEEMDAAIAKAEAATAKANQLAALNDVEKEHLGTLTTEADKDAFLAKSADERKSIITKKAEGDPVVYKAADGTEYRKSAGDVIIALVKRADASDALAKSEKEKRENAELAKRANEEFKNLPGTEAEKAALLKSLESIPDEAARKSAIAAVKAGDSAISDAYTRKGAGGGSVTESPAVAQLDTMAKKYAADNKVDFAKAYTHVVNTPEGSKLYEESLKK